MEARVTGEALQVPVPAAAELDVAGGHSRRAAPPAWSCSVLCSCGRRSESAGTWLTMHLFNLDPASRTCFCCQSLVVKQNSCVLSSTICAGISGKPTSNIVNLTILGNGLQGTRDWANKACAVNCTEMQESAGRDRGELKANQMLAAVQSYARLSQRVITSQTLATLLLGFTLPAVAAIPAVF